MEDFTVPNPFEVTFPSMTTSTGDTACASISIIDDDNLEGMHSFGISVVSTTPPVSTDTTLRNVFIQDNEGKICHIQQKHFFSSELLFTSHA